MGGLRPSIGICLLDAIEFRSEDAMYHGFQLRTEGGGLLLTDCPQIHLFELPKYVPPSDNGVISDPVEQWLYFFRRAEESTAEELTARLPGEEKGTGVVFGLGACYPGGFRPCGETKQCPGNDGPTKPA